MAKRKGRIPATFAHVGTIARPIGRVMILIFGGLLGTVLSVMTVAITLTFAWLTASGKWDGTIEAGDRSFAIDPMLETVLAWVIVGALFIANIGFYYLVVRLYRGR